MHSAFSYEVILAGFPFESDLLGKDSHDGSVTWGVGGFAVEFGLPLLLTCTKKDLFAIDDLFLTI